MQLKNTPKDLRTIGRELGVRYVLEGSVRKAGTRLRITAQLIDAHTDHHLWARKYDGSIDDVFDVQERVSREIVSALDVTLTAEEDDRLSDHPVRDARAFELYLRARQQIRRYSTEGVADFLARAIEIEGETPALRALRGWAWVNEVRIGVSRDQLVLTRAEDEARDLIAEAPGSGYGHALLGYIEYERGNMPAAVTHFHTALALEPNDPDSLVYQALAYGSAGQYESELEVGAQLLAVDPLGPLTHLVLGSANWFVGRAEEGTASLQRALELDPTNLLVHWALGYHYLLIQDLEGARRHRAWLNENGRDVPYTRQMNSLMLGLDGRAENALRELDGIDISFLDGHHSFHVAESYAMAGSADRALDLLESAVRLGFYPSWVLEAVPRLQRATLAAVFAVAVGCSGASVSEEVEDAGTSPYLYVWAGAEADDDSDFLAVVDADPSSPTYTQVLASVAVGLRGGAHHSEHVMPRGDSLFVNSFTAGTSFVIDLSEPTSPSVVQSFGSIGEYTYPHTFERLPNGHVLATFQTKGEGNARAGGLVELDGAGGLVRASDAADPVDPELRAYSVTPIPRLDRAVSTTSDMRAEREGTSFQVWRLSDLELLRTVRLPPGPAGYEHRDPAEVRLLADSVTALMTTFTCALYRLHDLEGENPSAELVNALPWSDYSTDECGIPATWGNIWLQTYAHSTGSWLISYDISDPSSPVELDRLSWHEEWYPHWISIEPGGRRVVLTSGEGGTLYRVLIVQLDPATGCSNSISRFGIRGAKDPE
jgi:tetratricopeptide (TPR) repeat protein